jgi:hypothetical protein
MKVHQKGEISIKELMIFSEKTLFLLNDVKEENLFTGKDKK